MKKFIALAVLIVLAGAATAQARVDFSVNIGIPVVPAPVVVAQPAPVPTVVGYPGYAEPIAYAEPAGYAEQPGFIYSPRLGFYVSVGLPYDVVYLDNCYYQYRGGYWYMSPNYRGPWAHVAQRRLPYGLHRHRYEQIRYYRDREYRSYLHDRDHYRGRWHRPVAVPVASRERYYDRREDHRYDRRDYYRNDQRVDRSDRQEHRRER